MGICNEEAKAVRGLYTRGVSITVVVAHPQIVDIGETVNIWRVPANILISCCRWLTMGVLQYGWPATLNALKKSMS
jgi:hypothetical protein